MAIWQRANDDTTGNIIVNDIRHGILDKRLMLDTGVVKNIFHKRKRGNEDRFWKSVNALSYSKSNHPFFVSSALMGVELLGFKILQLDPMANDESVAAFVKSTFGQMTPTNVHDGLALVMQRYLDWLDQHPLLTSAALTKRNDNELEFRAPWARGLMDLVVGTRLADPNLRNSFFRNIAYDRLQAVHYEDYVAEEVIVKKIDVAFLTASLIDLAEDRAIAPCRIIDRILIRAAKKVQGKDLDASYEYDADSVDTEIVYFSLVGHKNDSTERLESIVAFTTEKLEKWPPRIRTFMGALQYLDEAKRKTSPPLAIRPGMIVRVCDKTGEILGLIDLMKEFNFEGLLCDQDRVIQEWNGTRRS